jgi:peptidoglycan hydrolase CwlO-like protein
MADREEEIAGLPRGSAQNSFRVFAEWLKDNRKSIEQRLDSQDKLLIEIRQETKRTNGRVSDLEKDVELSKALADAGEQWDSEIQEHHEDKTRRWEGRATTAFGVIGGGIGASLGHHFGLW